VLREVLVGRVKAVKHGVEEEREEETIEAAAVCRLVARGCEVAGLRSVFKWESDSLTYLKLLPRNVQHASPSLQHPTAIIRERAKRCE
jgi:hypothetical protein